MKDAFFIKPFIKGQLQFSFLEREAHKKVVNE